MIIQISNLLWSVENPVEVQIESYETEGRIQVWWNTDIMVMYP